MESWSTSESLYDSSPELQDVGQLVSPPTPGPQPESIPNVIAEGSAFPRHAAADIPSHATRYISDSSLTDNVFRSLWAEGVPIVVTGLSAKFKIKWTPQYFKETYGNQEVIVTEAQTGSNAKINVRKFFDEFGKYGSRDGTWKLKVSIQLFRF